MNHDAFDVFNAPLTGRTLIEASAGTGKTFTLCALVLRLLLEQGLRVPQILVVTFTNAATAELRDRIRQRLADTLAALRGGSSDSFVKDLLAAVRQRVADGDEALALRLQQALQTFDEASIFTIHGFCQRALVDTPFTTGAPLLQELLADDGDLRLEVVNDFWRRHVASGSLSPALAAHLLARKDTPERWSALLQRRVAKPMSREIWPPQALAPAAAPMAALEQAFDTARRLWLADRAAVLDAVLASIESLHQGHYKSHTVAAAAADWDRWFETGNPVSAPAEVKKLALLSTRRYKAGKGKPAVRPHAFCAAATALLDAHEAATAALAGQRLALLRQLLAEGPLQLRELKRQRRVVAFDDLLFDLHARLAAPDGVRLAALLRARYPAALIDEFQDTDPLQYAIFHALYGGTPGSTLFLVGDPKQAIYSFRNADLHTYLQARDSADRTATLAHNQRSVGPLLDGLNALFGAHPQAFIQPGLVYRPVALGSKPKPTLRDHSEPRAALQLWQLPRGDEGLPLRKAQAFEAATRSCAAEVARLLQAAQQGQVTLDGRPLVGGDIALLVRTHSQGARLRQALAALGVGSVELSQASVHASPDAEQLEQVLAAVLQPARDALLRAALATELMGQDAAALEALASDEAALLDRVAQFAAWRDTWLQRGVGPMLRQWLQDDGVNQRLLQRPDGERRLTNVLHLAERLQQAAAEHPAPEALLRWLQQQRRNRDPDDSAQLRLESDRGLVQIVTIHKSKGLEFPIVFCPFLWDGHPGPADTLGDGIEHRDEHGLPVLDFGVDATDGALKAQAALERRAETLRLAYVALTRAVHRCVLVVGLYRSGPGATTHEARRSPLNGLAAGAGAAVDSGASDEAIDAAWPALAAAHGPAIDLSPLPAAQGMPVSLPRPAAGDLQALPAPARLPQAWWVGSYSALVQGLRHEGAAIDRDRLLPAEPAGTEPVDDVADGPASDPDDILQFPRGPAAGECLHAVFERADFDDATRWPQVVAGALRDHPQPTDDDQAAERHARQLLRVLRDVLNTPLPGALPGSFCLADLPRQRRLVELEFSLPVGRLSAAGLGALLRDHGHAMAPLAFGTLEGYLRGFIDLVFEHRGRWFIVDWKSNHLGTTPADYGPGPLARAMAEHGYTLQALLYTVALHRYLQQRLPGYRYQQHMGGVWMLFVRGVRPGWRQADGSACGVQALQPSAALVQALSDLLLPRGVPA